MSDFPFVDTEIVRDQLYQLNVSKSMWSDGIHHTVVEELVDVMAGYLSTLCQGSGESEEVPTDWNEPTVFRFTKKGLREDQETYKPVNITSISGKTMEKVIPCSTERRLKNSESPGMGRVTFLSF